MEKYVLLAIRHGYQAFITLVCPAKNAFRVTLLKPCLRHQYKRCANQGGRTDHFPVDILILVEHGSVAVEAVVQSYVDEKWISLHLCQVTGLLLEPVLQTVSHSPCVFGDRSDN